MQERAGVGSSVVIKGELTAREDVVIAGRVEGVINVIGHLVVVEAGAHVAGDITATGIVVAGRVEGSLIADERITVVNAPALDAIGSDPALEGPFDMVFIDALKPEYEAYLAALAGRLLPGALIAADNVLWSGRVSGSRPAAADDANTAALRAFDAAVLADARFSATILPVGDGLLIATWRG